MGWKVYLQKSSSTGTAWSVPGGPGFGISTAWSGTTALGFFTDGGSPVTVSSWQDRSALVQTTADGVLTRYVNNVKWISATGFACSTATQANGNVNYYALQQGAYTTPWATPKPSFGARFVFSTTGAVNFTQASAWWGVLNGAGTDVIGDSSDAGFKLAIKLLHSSTPWERDVKSTFKMSLLTNAGARASANYSSTTGAHWFLAFSATPNSAGAKGGAVALDITYS